MGRGEVIARNGQVEGKGWVKVRGWATDTVRQGMGRGEWGAMGWTRGRCTGWAGVRGGEKKWARGGGVRDGQEGAERTKWERTKVGS